MSIYRTTNPTQFAEVDGIVIAEQSPPPNVRGVGSGVAILVGQFSKGPTNELTEPGSQDNIDKMFGSSPSSPGYLALVNKKFARLKIIRVAGTGAAKASKSFSSNKITFTALMAGVQGNSITVAIEAASSGTGKKYTITDGDLVEIFDDVVLANINENTFASSVLVSATKTGSTEPTNTAATALSGGTDGTYDDAAYTSAIAVAEAEGAGNILFLDQYTASRNTLLKTHAALTQDKMVICAGAVDQTVAQAVTAVTTLRDNDGRIIYAFNWVKTNFRGVEYRVSPASFIASVLSVTSPHIDPSRSANTQELFGVTSLVQNLTRADYINLMNAGICSLEFDADIGPKIKSGVVTQIADQSKVTILRRRMTDFLTNSQGRFLKLYQGNVNSRENRDAAVAAMTEWDREQEFLGILPGDNEVQGGTAKIIDGEVLNTDTTLADGKFYILYKRRIFSSMRFIVLIAEVGTGVVVTEADEAA